MRIETTVEDELHHLFPHARPGHCIAIVGSRDFADLDRVRRFVRALPAGVTVLSGGARGVDRCAAATARARRLYTLELLPDWERDGHLAGRRRNERVAQRCDSLVAFWDGRSTGTQDAFRRALRLLRPVVVYRLRQTALVGTVTGRPLVETADGATRARFDLTVVRRGSNGSELVKVHPMVALGEAAQILTAHRPGAELRVRTGLHQVFASDDTGRLHLRISRAEALSCKRLRGKKRPR